MKHLLLLLAFLSPAAEAGITGRFSGTGTSTMHKSGNLRKCEEIFLQAEMSQTKFRLLDGGYKCEDMEASIPAYELTIRNGKLFDGSLEVGTANENTVDLFYENKEENFTYHWLLELKGEKLRYLEEWKEAQKPALTVSGTLTKKN